MVLELPHRKDLIEGTMVHYLVMHSAI